MKHLRTILALCLSLAIASGVLVADAFANPRKSRQQSKVPSTTIPVTLYGMHINQDTDPLPPTGWFGQQRLWDSQTNWYQLEPNQSVTITAVARTNDTSTVYVTPEPQGWMAGTTVFVNLPPGSALSSFNGLYTINTVDTTNGTITYTQDLVNVAPANISGTANNFDFSVLDLRLAYAAAPNLQVMYTFGKVPSFYSSQPTGDCKANPVGTCYRPNDLNADGTGTNQNWRLFVAGLAEHIASLESSPIPYAIPAYFETWNEFNEEGFWHYNDSTDDTDDPKALVRLLDDAACIIKGTGTIHGIGSCATAPNFVVKSVLPSAQMLPPCVNSPADVDAWANFYSSYSDAAANADIIGVHTYDYADNIQGISAIQRASNTVTVTVGNTASYAENLFVKVSGVQDGSFDGTFTVTSVTDTQITYSQSGVNASSSGGHIQNGPDQLQPALSTFRSGLSTTDQAKPFWVTEGQWGMSGPTDATTQEGYIVRFFTILWSTGVSRGNWYSWDLDASLWESSSNTGDVACDGMGNDPKCNPPEPSSGWGYVTLPGQAHSVGEGWLLGTTMIASCSATGSVWTCGLQTAASQNELMVWDSAQDRTNNTSFYTPTASYTAYFDLSGTKHSCLPGSCNHIPIGAAPILFVNN